MDAYEEAVRFMHRYSVPPRKVGYDVTNYGTIIAGGFAIPVTYMSIVNGNIKLVGVRPGPVPAYEGPYTVVGLDNKPLARIWVPDGSVARWDEVSQYQNLVLPIFLALSTDSREIRVPELAEPIGVVPRGKVLQGRVEADTKAIEG